MHSVCPCSRKSDRTQQVNTATAIWEHLTHPSPNLACGIKLHCLFKRSDHPVMVSQNQQAVSEVHVQPRLCSSCLAEIINWGVRAVKVRPSCLLLAILFDERQSPSTHNRAPLELAPAISRGSVKQKFGFCLKFQDWWWRRTRRKKLLKLGLSVAFHGGIKVTFRVALKCWSSLTHIFQGAVIISTC